MDWDEPGPSCWSDHLDLRPLVALTDDYVSEEFDSDEFEGDRCLTDAFLEYLGEVKADDPNGDQGVGANTDEDPLGLDSNSAAEGKSDLELCLEANCSYQDDLAAIIEELTEAFEKNRLLQKELEEQRPAQKTRRRKPKKRKNWHGVYVFHHPYFIDVDGMPAPPNEDALTKRANKEMDPYISPAAPWNRDERRWLVTAVHKTLMQQNVEALRNRRETLAEQLKSTVYQKEIDALEERIQQLDDKVSLVRKMSLKQLLLYSTLPVDWLRVSAVGIRTNRTPFRCEIQWRNLADVRLNQNPWTEDEEEKLCALATKYDERNWDLVAQELDTGRSAFQCAQHYSSHHATRLSVGRFTQEEDKRLIELVDCCRNVGGISWAQVAYSTEGRTMGQLRSRYKRTLAPNLVHGYWTSEEDMMLLVAVSIHGTEKWSKVAEMIPRRLPSQCQDHYIYYFDYKVVLGPFSPLEHMDLVKAVEKHGERRWTEVAKEVPGRTATNLRRCYYQLQQLFGKDKVTSADLEKYHAGPPLAVSKALCRQTTAMDRRMDTYKRIRNGIKEPTLKAAALKLAKGLTVDQDTCMQLHQLLLDQLKNGHMPLRTIPEGRTLNKAIAMYAQPVLPPFSPNMGGYERQEWQAVKNVLFDLHNLDGTSVDPCVIGEEAVSTFADFFRNSVLAVPTEFQPGVRQLLPLLPPNETTVTTFGRLVDRFLDGEPQNSLYSLQDSTCFPELSASLDAVDVESIRCADCRYTTELEEDSTSIDSMESAPGPENQACLRCGQLRETRRQYDMLCGRFMSYFFWPFLLDEQNVADTVKLSKQPPKKRRKSHPVRKRVKKPWVRAKWAERRQQAAKAAAAMSCQESHAGQPETDVNVAAGIGSADGAGPSTSRG